MTDLRVLKFGGTSMGSAEAMRSAGEIVKNTAGNKAVVVSATAGTTNQLVELARLSEAGENWEGLLDEMIQRHEQIISALEIECDISHFRGRLERILGMCEGAGNLIEAAPVLMDALYHFGEAVSATIFSQYLNSIGVAAQSFDSCNDGIIHTDNKYMDANVDFEETNRAISEVLKPVVDSGKAAVVTGFFGRSKNGRCATFARGGSDYSAGILGAGLGADEVVLYKEEDGICSADPRIVGKENVRVLDQISYIEAVNMALRGAKVLHPRTMDPTRKANIPIRIKNTFNPDAPGTVINNEKRPTLKGVVREEGVRVVTIKNPDMYEAAGFLSKVYGVFEEYGIPVDVVGTSEESFSSTVDRKIPDEMMKKLKGFGEVEVLRGQSIVGLVGHGIDDNGEDTIARFFRALGVKPSLISKAAGGSSLTVAVAGTETREAIRRIHAEFFEQGA
ncbi:MAG: aspartate kinase [Candidatus Peregrinibacteria bacterium]